MTLTQLAAGLPVDVMPGEGDPASAALPQQPLHRCLFPGASTFATFTPVTNPHEFSADGVAFLGTSGQNVDDVWKCALLPLSWPDRPCRDFHLVRWSHVTCNRAPIRKLVASHAAYGPCCIQSRAAEVWCT